MPLLDGDGSRSDGSCPGSEAVEVLDRVRALSARAVNAGSDAAGRPDVGNLTLANQLTILRIMLIPAFVLLLVYGYLGRRCSCSCSPASPTRSTG